TGAGGFTQAGSGTTTLNATNSYTGATTVSAGTLALGHATNTLSSSSAVTVDGATAVLSIAGNSDTVGAVSLKNGGSITGTGGTLTGASYAVESGSVSAILGGASIALTKSTAGTVTLSGANSYTGATTVSAGTLQLGSGSTTGTLSASSAISVGTGATFAVNRSNAATQGTDFSSAAITGAGGFTQAGSGTTTLNAANTYTGSTTVNAGILAINGIQSAATGNVTVASGATLKGTGTVGGATTVQSGGILNAGAHSATSSSAVGTETFSTNLTYASSSIFAWDLNANRSGGTGTAGTDYDRVVVGGNLNIASDAVFRVIMGSSVNFATTFWNSNQMWNNIFSVTGTTTGGWAANTFVNVYNYDFANNTYSVSNPTAEGYFTASGSTLAWNAIPEPTSALAGLLIGAGLLRRRRCA
ncbi:MAG: autotransporter-associated beta strand repeat-containing protein, partial [Verrucomicrobiota bacterium]